MIQTSSTNVQDQIDDKQDGVNLASSITHIQKHYSVPVESKKTTLDKVDVTATPDLATILDDTFALSMEHSKPNVNP